VENADSREKTQKNAKNLCQGQRLRGEWVVREYGLVVTNRRKVNERELIPAVLNLLWALRDTLGAMKAFLAGLVIGIVLVPALDAF
jgi:hypothetical protein